MRLGPAVLVTAAFIGPGTVTTCIVSGSSFGYTLVWALVFATAATIVLQEMAGRLGAGAGLGLGEALNRAVAPGPLRWAVAALLVTALAVGNAAYQAGNLRGGALGYDALAGRETSGVWSVLSTGAVAAVILWRGSYRTYEKVLTVLVALMSAAFVLTAILARPDIPALFGGLAPRLPDAGVLAAAALVGTTVVPYNLFLHAAAARERFAGAGRGGAKAARLDTVVAVSLGGLVSLAILTTAAAGATGEPVSASTIAGVLEPSLGQAGRILIGIGLLSAGLTSAVTAPLAAGYVMSELLGQPGGGSRIFRGTALGVLFAGVLFAATPADPIALIVAAQAANGLLLPLVAVYLLLVMNRRDVLGAATNGAAANIVGGLVVLLTFGLALRVLANLAGLL